MMIILILTEKCNVRLVLAGFLTLNSTHSAVIIIVIIHPEFLQCRGAVN